MDRDRPSGSSTPEPTGLASLPHEILEQIFLILRLEDRLRLLRTCSTLKEVYSSSAQLQYSFTLQTSAYVDCPFIEAPPPSADLPAGTSGSSAASQAASSSDRTPNEAGPSKPKRRPLIPLSPYEKNELLRAREQRWSTIEPKEIRPLNVNGREGVYELQEGIFLMCDGGDGDDIRPRSIRLIPLPSSENPNVEDPPAVRAAGKMDFPIADLTMDPTQDLIVVSESTLGAIGHMQGPTHRYHLLTMSTFKPHPLAALPILDFPPFTTPGITRQLIQVMGDTLIILVSRYHPAWMFAGLGLNGFAGLGTEEEIIAWNWKTGRVLMRHALPENGWFSSLALLTPTSFMVTSTSNISPILPVEPNALGATFPPVIQVYSFAPDPQHCIVPVQPLEVEHLDDTTPRPVLLVQLELPRLASGVRTEGFDVRPDPAFPPHQSGPNPTLSSGKAFTQDPSKGVLVFELHLGEPNGVNQADEEIIVKKSYELFMLRETLVDMVHAGEARLIRARSEDGGEDGLGVRGVERTLSWADWGQRGARLMDITMHHRSWVCSCSGYRFISIMPTFPPNWSDEHAFADLNEMNGLRVPARHSDLLLYDFSPYSVRNTQSTAKRYHDGHDVIPTTVDNQKDDEDEDRCTVEVIDEPTILEKRKIWKEDVISTLPYKTVRRKWGQRANGVMIDDQRILVVCTLAKDNGDIEQEISVLCM